MPMVEGGDPRGAGHRKRLKTRFLGGEPEAQTDAAILELLLFQIVPIQDVQPRVQELLQQHGSLAGVLNGTGEWPEKLREARKLVVRLADRLRLAQS